MQYRRVPKNGDQVSALGFGAMRLPAKRGAIDEERAIRQIRSAIESGVNYIDTAFPYHGGESERLVGKALLDGYRERVKVATKLPPWSITNREDMDKILAIQLKKLQTDHIDYYLIHSLDAATWKKMRDLGVLEFLEEAKKDGKIRNIGFSFHGDRKTFREIIDAYDWVFCQIQYNFLDEETQAGTEGLVYAASKDIAVIIMEPLRGGMLAGDVPKEVKEIYASAPVKRTPASWGLRWVWDHPEVTVILSGMNDEDHIRENISDAEEALPGSMSSEDRAMMDEVKRAYQRLMKVGCTGCSYCMPCPFGVDIPQCFYFYNQYYMGGSHLTTRGFYGMKLMGGMGVPAHASLCRNCGRCLAACPQHIAIPEELKKVAGRLDGWMTRLVLIIAKRIFSTKIAE